MPPYLQGASVCVIRYKLDFTKHNNAQQHYMQNSDTPFQFRPYHKKKYAVYIYVNVLFTVYRLQINLENQHYLFQNKHTPDATKSPTCFGTLKVP